jgi:hypothetical protein
MSSLPVAPLHQEPSIDEERAIGKSGILRVARGSVFLEKGYHVWCSSVVAAEGAWWLLFSRWPEKTGHYGWATHSEIAVAQGPSPTGPFRSMGRVMLPCGERHPWERDVAHNPTVIADEGSYLLAYMANHGPVTGITGSADRPVLMDDAWWTHRNNQRIGVARAKHPAGPWETTAEPVLDVCPTGWDCQLVTNPTVFRRADGRWTMIYKGVADGPQPFGGKVLHGVAEAPDPQGPYVRQTGVHPFAAGASSFPAEDPYAWYDKTSGFYRAVVKDMNGELTGQGRSLAFYHSKDAFNWELSPIPPISGAKLLMPDGTLLPCARIERPQITVDAEGRPVALHVACLPEAADGISFSVSVPIPPGFFAGNIGEDFYYFEK